MILKLKDLVENEAMREEIREIFSKQFWVDDKRGCFIWNGDAYKNGYGKFSVMLAGGRIQMHIGAHRLSYMLSTGEDPGEFLVCHRCDTPLCVNPDHLFKGTAGDNMRDKYQKGRGNL